ncbi:winged helix-turn-helix transcriptional regulator [Candidatus Woesearchaeota archaeon]|nr:winged helix-turn-helix transcriptional regulator [Candidatus Woesearchaeota archaeon]
MDFPEENLVRGLSASSRRQLLNLISEKQLTVKELAAKTGQSVSLASRHLKFLYDLGFLNVEKRFPCKFYSLKNSELRELLKNYQKTIGASSKIKDNNSEDDDDDDDDDNNKNNSNRDHGENLARALGAESRRQLLRLIAENSNYGKKITVKELASKTGQSVSLASRHLKFLYDLGFLNVNKQFPYKYYSLKTKELQELLVHYNKITQKT